MASKNLHLQRAVAALNQSNFREAEGPCRRALGEQPTSSTALYALALIHSDRGDDIEAQRLLRSSIHCDRRSSSAYRLLALTYYLNGRLDEAAQVYRDWLTVEPHNPEVQHMVAANSQDSPPRSAEAYVKGHFDEFAKSFDDVLVRKLGYRGPELVAAAFEKHVAAAAGELDVLDAGCGTGLCGPRLRGFCRTLIGVDLSERMLSEARERSCYDALVSSEICKYLGSQSAAFDVIVSADVLVYFGALDDFTNRAARALRPGGLLIATTEALPDEASDPYLILPNGRYAHRIGYVHETLTRAGFDEVASAMEPIRWEVNRPAMGHCIVARKTRVE